MSRGWAAGCWLGPGKHKGPGPRCWTKLRGVTQDTAQGAEVDLVGGDLAPASGGAQTQLRRSHARREGGVGVA